jgi:predicted dehydrogenase
MLQPLVVGLGRAGAGLHLAVLSRALAAGAVAGPIVACDPRHDAARRLDEIRVATSIDEAARLVMPQSTVVHVCTPPGSRSAVLAELAGLGFRRILVEKPLAVDTAELAAIEQLRSRYSLRVRVVAHWLSAELTRRLETLVQDRVLGQLISIRFAQHKPRFLRSLASQGHPTAFDVEVPHSLGVALHLAGDAEVLDAEATDLRLGEVVLPRMGSARLTVRHRTGVVTEIVSDLTAPVRERSIRLDFEGGTVTGHYPLSEDDDHAQLVAENERHIFRDDALSAFMLRTYRAFEDEQGDDFALHRTAVRLLADAKDISRREEKEEHAA